jgi:hypothetical protein
MATVKCPSCNRQLEVEDEHRDWTVRCPYCEHEFVPDDVQAAQRPRRRRRDEDEDDRDEERYGEPAGYRTAAYEEALQLVAAPATMLEICGWLSALGAVGITVVCMMMADEIANNPQANQNGDPAELFIFLGCCGGILLGPYGVAMAIGARKMRNLSSRGWAMAGAILGVAAFSLIGFFGVIHTGIGAWALITLDKPAVREAFGLPPRPGQSRRRRRDWDD